MCGTGKSEIRISKLEVNTNDKNINDQNEKWSYHDVSFRILKIRISILFRISNFDIRIFKVVPVI